MFITSGVGAERAWSALSSRYQAYHVFHKVMPKGYRFFPKYFNMISYQRVLFTLEYTYIFIPASLETDFTDFFFLTRGGKKKVKKVSNY